MGDGQRRLAAIMFTDMKGYTLLSHKDEASAMELLEEHRKLLRPFFPMHTGREVKTMGDAFLVEFASALEAVRCGFDIQKALHELNSGRPEERKIMLRIGIHLGDVIHSQNDVYGDAVNVASRIQPLAEPGGICVSEQVYDQVKSKVAYPFVRLAPHELKNVEEPVNVYKLIPPWQEALPQWSLPASAKQRIAVLPFMNISADPGDEYFADGMTEELISTLSNIRGLNVISRTSVMNYRSPTKRVGEISRELNAGILLEGSVRKSANRVRITVQLIDATEDQHLWSEQYDRELGDVFAIQGEIAQQVAKAMRAELLSSASERIKRGNTGSTEAHMTYLKGRYHLNRATVEGFFKAIEYLDEAVKEDPAFAGAFAALSECYTYLAGEGLEEREAFLKAEQYATKAITLDDGLADGHASLGIVALQHDWDWVKTEREFKRAIELNPSHSTAHLWYGIYHALFRQVEEGISELRIAEGLDPLSPLIKVNFGIVCYYAGLYAEAKTKLFESKELEAGNQFSYLALGLVYLQESKFDDALTELTKAITLGEASPVLGVLGYVQAISGRKKEATETLEKLTGMQLQGKSGSTEIAMVHLGLGDLSRALELLEKALERRESWLILSHRFPLFDALTSNPRYAELVEKMGLPR